MLIVQKQKQKQQQQKQLVHFQTRSDRRERNPGLKRKGMGGLNVMDVRKEWIANQINLYY